MFILQKGLSTYYINIRCLRCLYDMNVFARKRLFVKENEKIDTQFANISYNTISWTYACTNTEEVCTILSNVFSCNSYECILTIFFILLSHFSDLWWQDHDSAVISASHADIYRCVVHNRDHGEFEV